MTGELEERTEEEAATIGLNISEALCNAFINSAPADAFLVFYVGVSHEDGTVTVSRHNSCCTKHAEEWVREIMASNTKLTLPTRGAKFDA